MGEPTVSQPRQDGYSIVELLVAVTVFALVFAAVANPSPCASKIGPTSVPTGR